MKNLNVISDKSVLLLLATSLAAFEFFIPRIPLFPWLKPGLANAVTLLWIIRYGTVDALLFVILRLWIVGFYFGFSFFTLILGLSGGIFATIMMGILWKTLGQRKISGLIGMGILGATTHNMVQLIVVFSLITKNYLVFYQLPIMIIASIFFGTLVSILVPILDNLVITDQNEIFQNYNTTFLNKNYKIDFKNIVLSLLFFLFNITLVWISNKYILSVTAILVTTIVQIVKKGSLKELFKPITKFWMLFITIATFNLLFTPGKILIRWLPFLTTDGINETVVQWLRIWTWLQTSAMLREIKFHIVLFKILKKIFKNHTNTISSGLISLEYFPDIVEIIRKTSMKNYKQFFKNPIRWGRRNMEDTVYNIKKIITD